MLLHILYHMVHHVNAQLANMLQCGFTVSHSDQKALKRFSRLLKSVAISSALLIAPVTETQAESSVNIIKLSPEHNQGRSFESALKELINDNYPKNLTSDERTKLTQSVLQTVYDYGVMLAKPRLQQIAIDYDIAHQDNPLTDTDIKELMLLLARKKDEWNSNPSATSLSENLCFVYQGGLHNIIDKGQIAYHPLHSNFTGQDSRSLVPVQMQSMMAFVQAHETAHCILPFL